MPEKLSKGQDFSIHTFGYGNDADTKLMKQIAETKLGNFYYVEEPSLIQQSFSDCLSALMSISVVDVNLTVSFNRSLTYCNPEKTLIFEKKISVSDVPGGFL